jgi:nicotinate-nucleotide--dimethylbenzimidazole phosphoribosyltransferase
VSDLSTLAADVPWPDSAAEQTVRDRLAQPDAQSLGRLAELVEWLAGTQGAAPPHDPRRARLLVLCDDGDPGAGGIAAVQTGVGWRCASIPRRASFADCVQAGVDLVDEEVDSGTDLLVLGDRDEQARVPAAVVVSLLAGTEPVRLVSHRDGIDDERWMGEVIAVRDLRRRSAGHRADPAQLLEAVGSPTLTALVAALLRAAGRSTPVLLDGLAVTAALAARELAPRTIRWWQVGARSRDRATGAALERLRLDPLLDLDTDLEAGAGAVMAMPLLRIAVELFAAFPASARPAAGSAGMESHEGWLDDRGGDVTAADVEEDV